MCEYEETLQTEANTKVVNYKIEGTWTLDEATIPVLPPEGKLLCEGGKPLFI